MASDNMCESCLLKEKSTISVKLCTDCDERLCEECSVNHLSFKVLKLHNLILLTPNCANTFSVDKGCPRHENVILDFYCSQHDAICCRACTTEAHLTCKNVIPIDVASKNVKNSSLLTKTLDEMSNIANKLQTVLELNDINIKRLDDTATSIIREIVAYKRLLIQQLDKVEQKLLQNLTTAQIDVKFELEKKKSHVAELITENEKGKHALECLQENGTNDQLFLALHKYNKEIKETETELTEIISTWKDTGIKFEQTAINLDSLGTIIHTTRPYSVQYTSTEQKQMQTHSDISNESLSKLKRDSDISLEQIKHCNLTDIAVTGDNKLLLCNFSSQDPKVYIYTDCKHYENELLFSSRPYKCAVIQGTTKAVVSLPDENSIQLNNTATMTKGDKIKLGFKPYGIATSADRIVIGGNGEVFVFDIDWTFRKKIAISGSRCIYFISYNKQYTEILCKDDRMLFCIDLDGHVLYQYKVGFVAGIAVERYGDVFVGEYYANKVHRLSSEGKLKDIVITNDDGINHPYAMTFNIDFNKLFIICNGLQTVTCFTCS